MSGILNCPFETGITNLAEGISARTNISSATDKAKTQTSSLKLAAATTTAEVTWAGAVSFVVNRTYYMRANFYVASGTLTGSPGFFGVANDTAAQYVGVTLKEADGHLSLEVDGAGGVFSSDLGVCPRDQWFSLEFSLRMNSSGNDVAEARIDGVAVGSQISQNIGTTATERVYAFYTDPAETGGANGVDMWMGDLTVNDDQGSSENTWPGIRQIYLAMGTSDNAVGTGFEAPQTTGSDTTNLFASVATWGDGVAHSDVDANNLKYVFNAASTSTANLDLNLPSYTALGIGASDVIKIAHALATTGSSSATDTAGALNFAPDGSTFGTETSFAAFDNGVAGTMPTNWRRVAGDQVYAPSVSKANTPILRVGKRTAQTRVCMIDALGLVINVAPSVAPTTYFKTLTVTPLVLTTTVPKKTKTTKLTSVILTATRVNRGRLVKASTVGTATTLPRKIKLVKRPTVTLATAVVKGHITKGLTATVQLASSLRRKTGKRLTTPPLVLVTTAQAARKVFLTLTASVSIGATTTVVTNVIPQALMRALKTGRRVGSKQQDDAKNVDNNPTV